MFWAARQMGFGMIFGMFLIIRGIALSAMARSPPDIATQIAAAHDICVAAPESWCCPVRTGLLMLILVVALSSTY